MNERYVAALCLVMVAVLGAVAWQQQANIQDLNHEVIHLQNIILNYDILAHNLDRLNESYAQLVSDIAHFNTQINQSSTFQTPVSKSQAISIALAYGGWNATTLRDRYAVASLQYYGYNSIGSAMQRWWIKDVAEPVSDYSPVQEGSVTYRYEWVVVVTESGPYPLVLAGYYIDASNGQIMNQMLILYNPAITYTFNNQTDGRLTSDFKPIWQG